MEDLNEDEFFSKGMGELNRCFDLATDDVPFAAVIVLLFTVGVPFEEVDTDILPAIKFGITAETGLNVVGSDFETMSRLELVENGRCVCGI